MLVWIGSDHAEAQCCDAPNYDARKWCDATKIATRLAGPRISPSATLVWLVRIRASVYRLLTQMVFDLGKAHKGHDIVTITPELLGNAVRDGMKAEIAPLFDELRRFTDRRIAELSAEINATVQLVDYSESNLSGQLSQLRDQITSMVAAPAAASRNSGLELEAVVQATEAAANQIMEAAEAIGDWLRDGSRDPGSMETVAAKLNSIFEACTFQDVTGQRVRRAIQHLQNVEMILTDLMPVRPEAVATNDLTFDPDLIQDDVDRMFG